MTFSFMLTVDTLVYIAYNLIFGLFGDKPIITGLTKDRWHFTTSRVSLVAVAVRAMMLTCDGMILLSSPVTTKALRKLSTLK